jgi:drug/metabolite transporter (DMT)-like permease
LTTERKALAAVAVVSFFWGTTYIVSRYAVGHLSGLYLASLRNVLAGGLIVLLFLLRGRPLPSAPVLWRSAFLGLIMIAVSSGLSLWSVEYISGSLAALIGATIPLWLALFSMVRGSRLNMRLVTGLLTGFAGIAVIFFEHLDELLQSGFRFGIGLAVTSCITWAAASVYTSTVRLGIGLLYGVGWQMLFAGLFLLPVCAWTGRLVALDALPADAWYAILYLTFIGSMLTYSCYIYAILHLPPARAGVYAYINPVVAVVLGHLWLQEKFSLAIAAGTLITLAGVYIVNASYIRKA